MTLRAVVRCLSVAMVFAAACGPAKEPATDTLTQRQRDSAIGASALPGARGVQQATRASDSARARAARLDGAEP